MNAKKKAALRSRSLKKVKSERGKMNKLFALPYFREGTMTWTLMAANFHILNACILLSQFFFSLVIVFSQQKLGKWLIDKRTNQNLILLRCDYQLDEFSSWNFKINWLSAICTCITYVCCCCIEDDLSQKVTITFIIFSSFLTFNQPFI